MSANSPPRAYRCSSGQKPQYGLMSLKYQRFIAVLLLIYGSLFLSGVYYCLSVFWCLASKCTCSHSTGKQIAVLEHPPYSPNLAPSDFFLLLKIKEILKGRHSNNTDDIRSNMMAALKAIPQNQFQNCFEGCTRRWHQCCM
jgi:hypothetical protein